MGNKPKPKPNSNTIPPNWPSHLCYLTHPLYSRHLTPSHLLALRTPPSPSPSETSSTADLPSLPLTLRPGPSSSVRILRITDPSHPANGQHGLFAARHLRPGEFILAYLGQVHVGSGPGSEEHATSDYDLWVDRDGDVAVDAARAGNEARFVNDYRGVPGQNLGLGRAGERKDKSKKRANAEFRTVWDGRRGERGMGVYVLPAGKKAVGREREVGIGKGEEILVSYGKGFWGGRKGEGEGEGKGEGGEVGNRG